MVLVGPGYDVAEVAGELSLPVLGTLPWDERGAAALAGRAARQRRTLRCALGRAAAGLAVTFAAASLSSSTSAAEPDGAKPTAADAALTGVGWAR